MTSRTAMRGQSRCNWEKTGNLFNHGLPSGVESGSTHARRSGWLHGINRRSGCRQRSIHSCASAPAYTGFLYTEFENEGFSASRSEPAVAVTGGGRIRRYWHPARIKNTRNRSGPACRRAEALPNDLSNDLSRARPARQYRAAGIDGRDPGPCSQAGLSPYRRSGQMLPFRPASIFSMLYTASKKLMV